jgi:hypothetical protein
VHLSSFAVVQIKGQVRRVITDTVDVGFWVLLVMWGVSEGVVCLSHWIWFILLKVVVVGS